MENLVECQYIAYNIYTPHGAARSCSCIDDLPSSNGTEQQGIVSGGEAGLRCRGVGTSSEAGPAAACKGLLLGVGRAYRVVHHSRGGLISPRAPPNLSP